VQNKVLQNEAFSTHRPRLDYRHNSLLYVQFSPEIATFVVKFHTFDRKKTTFEQQGEHVALDWTCNMHTLILGLPLTCHLVMKRFHNYALTFPIGILH